MGIGTSLGAFYDTEFKLFTGKGEGLAWNDALDQNEFVVEGDTNNPDQTLNPDALMRNRLMLDDPKNIYNDQGIVVDYDLGKLPTMKEIDKTFEKLK